MDIEKSIEYILDLSAQLAERQAEAQKQIEETGG